MLRKEMFRWMDIFDNLHKKLTDNKGEDRPIWISEKTYVSQYLKVKAV